jgi:hypothetical protein
MALVDGEVKEELVGMTKSVDHLVSPLPKLIHTGLKTGVGIIPYEDPEALINPGEVVLKLDEIEEDDEGEESDEIIKEILDYNLLTLPLLENADPGTKISIILPAILNQLKKATGSKIETAKIGTTTFLISVEKETRKKRYLWKDKVMVEKKYYIFYLNPETGEIKVKKWKEPLTYQQDS